MVVGRRPAWRLLAEACAIGASDRPTTDYRLLTTTSHLAYAPSATCSVATAGAAGRSIVNVAPVPYSLVAEIVPPWAVTTSRVMLSPSPDPWPALLVVTQGSKIRGSR